MANLRADEKEKMIETVQNSQNRFKERIEEIRREISEKVSQEMQEYYGEVPEYAKCDLIKYISEANKKRMEITRKALAEAEDKT